MSDINENENLLNGAQVEIQGIDSVLSTELFMNLKQYSLAQDIFPEVPVNSPTGQFFNVKKKGTHNFEVIRKDFEVYSNKPDKTGLTQEAYQDLVAIHGQESQDRLFQELFQGILNQDTNEKTQTFLDQESASQDDLDISEEVFKDAEKLIYQIVKKVGELVHEANRETIITRKQYCVMPSKFSQAFELLSLYGKIPARSDYTNIVQESTGIVFALNPNVDEDSVYVGLRDSNNASKSQAILSPYVTDIQKAESYETGDINFHIFDRYQITQNPLHNKDVSPMMWKFDINVN